ncbi:MAG: NUDIX domain-containing protein [Gaiellaceae bacterium]
MTAAAVAVWRRTEAGVEWLVLHRSHFDAEFTGDWAWGPPGGGADPGETAEECAHRELREETALSAACVATDCGVPAAELLGWDFVLFHAEVPPDAEVQLSWEHDAYRWLPLDEAQPLCRPGYVGDQLACVAALVGER